MPRKTRKDENDDVPPLELPPKLTKPHCEIKIMVRNDDSIDTMWKKLQDLLRARNLPGTYAMKKRNDAEKWFIIDLTDGYYPVNPLPEPWKEICRYLQKMGYKYSKTGAMKCQFDP